MSSKGLRAVGWALLSAGCLYGFSGASLSKEATILAGLFAFIALAAWVRTDALTRGVALAYDWPWLMMLGWPVSVVWYARRTRRSWLRSAGLAGLPVAFLFGVFLAGVVRLFLQLVAES